MIALLVVIVVLLGLMAWRLWEAVGYLRLLVDEGGPLAPTVPSPPMDSRLALLSEIEQVMQARR